KFVDLCVAIKEPNPGGFSSDELRRSLSCSIEYQDHECIGAQQRMNIFICQKEDVPDGLGWAAEIREISTHAGTHLDAPYHYYPTTGGSPAKTVEELPLDWFFGNGVVLDFRHKQNGEAVSVEDVKEALTKINYTL